MTTTTAGAASQRDSTSSSRIASATHRLCERRQTRSSRGSGREWTRTSVLVAGVSAT